MPRRRKRRKLGLTPSYRRDRSDPDRTVAVWKDLAGARYRKILPGGFNSPEFRTVLEQLKAEVKESATGVPPRRRPLTVAGLQDAYLKYAERYYRTPDGKPTSTLYHCKDVGQALCELYAHTPAAKFGPLCLQTALQRWANERRTRSQCNRRLTIAKRIFRWAVSCNSSRPRSSGHLRASAACSAGGRRPGRPSPSGPSMTRPWTPPCRSSTATSAGW